jgi:hypothetical protein
MGRVLMALPRCEPRTESASHLRARCHDQLTKRLPARPVPAPILANRGRLLAGTALAGALGLIYLADVVRRALSLYGF